MKTLSIVESAYRATIEEQDDTIVWIHGAMKGAGADLVLLLRGNAVNYLVESQNAGGLSFGDWEQTQPPRIASDLAALAAKGVEIGNCQINLCRAEGAPSRIRDHAAATAFLH